MAEQPEKHAISWARLDGSELPSDFAEIDDAQFWIARENLISSIKFFENVGYRVKVDVK